MSTRNGILFISHSASRTGAPIVLLHFLRWFKQNVKAPFELVCNEGGELERDFKELCPVHTLDRFFLDRRSHLRQIGYRYLPRTGRLVDASRLRWTLRGLRPSLIYANTAGSARVLAALPAFAAPIVSHIHELEYALRWDVGLPLFDLVKRRTNHWVAAAQAVADNLVANHGIPASDIDVVQLLPAQSLGAVNAAAARTKVIQRLNLPADALIVGGSGVMGWRKGTDLFVQLAADICRLHPSLPVHFVWVGWGDKSAYGAQMLHDAQHAGIAGRLHLAGQVEDPRDYYASFELLVLCSREDPFPLVGLETAAMGIPLVCFSGAGGMPEFIEQDCGVAVPYLNLPAMGEAVVDLLQNPQRRSAMGEVGRAKVASRHDIAVAAPRLAEIIQRVQSSAARS